MRYNPEIHHRRSTRLAWYDYSQEGGYFVTICTHERERVFGEIVGGEMRLSEIGLIARNCWEEIPRHFPNVQLDEYVVMPNHVHGILIIRPNYAGVQNSEPLRNKFQKIIPKSLGSIIRSYKAAVTRNCRRQGNGHFQWQKNFYEHIIRDQVDLNRIQEYIANNPLQWTLDEENPPNMKRR